MINITDQSSGLTSGATAHDGGIALGLGLTNECNLSSPSATAIQIARIVSLWIK